MSTIQNLQQKMSSLTQQINDIFHAISLNIDALQVQIEDNHQTKEEIQKSKKDLNNIVQAFKQRQDLRLNYLITQQIKQQEAKVRRQRLMEYQQKIYDQRRLISDKEAFFESLLRPKRKKPANMTAQQYQQLRKREMEEQQQKHLKILGQQIHELEQLDDLLKYQNEQLEKIVQQQQEQMQTNKKQQALFQIFSNNPHIYQIINRPHQPKSHAQLKEIIDSIYSIKQQNSNLLQQITNERQMQQYLKWEHEKLVNQYKEKSQLYREETKRAKNDLLISSKPACVNRSVSL